MSRNFKTLEERMDYMEFRQQLLFYNTEVNRLLFEYEISSEEYQRIMDVMDELRKDIGNKKKVLRGDYENKIYEIIPNHNGDYHMCEYLARAFMDEGRWEEVFPVLYGDLPKYQYLNGATN